MTAASITLDDFHTLAVKVLPHAGRDVTARALFGVWLFEHGGHLMAAATDHHTLGIAAAPKSKADEGLAVFVPTPQFEQVVRTVRDSVLFPATHHLTIAPGARGMVIEVPTGTTTGATKGDLKTEAFKIKPMLARTRHVPPADLLTQVAQVAARQPVAGPHFLSTRALGRFASTVPDFSITAHDDDAVVIRAKNFIGLISQERPEGNQFDDAFKALDLSPGA